MKEKYDITFLESGTKIYQLTDGFRFSVDPVILADFFEGNPKGKVLDIGSGCGIIPILLAEKKGMKDIWGVEIQKSSAEVFKKNIEENNFSDRITVLNCDVEELTCGNSFDYIISNPPYMAFDGKKISENENKKIARHEIYLDLQKLIKNAKRLLKPRGEFFLVHRSHRFLEIAKILEENNFSVKRVCFTFFDKEKDSNLVLIQASKGRKHILKIESPLFLQEKGY
ncbi:methyltransferase [Fusobacterium perfoetens]|uniref:tRNA1(Val) (adenine(37)-N6)-methyltransferase n=1 Tax=Fusobacterium perfoetens TaxID=852 RepID=UPI0015A0504F|nr:methyltransferase [Fusobacterium perfoetens]MCF2624857.1 methyltransferase [Fusobacterium perfoetens]